MTSDRHDRLPTDCLTHPVKTTAVFKMETDSGAVFIKEDRMH